MVVLDTTGQMIAFNPGNPEYYYTHSVPLGATGSATKVYRLYDEFSMMPP
jgi:hypothetical protein